MNTKKFLALLLAASLTAPGWAASSPLGVVAASTAASVAGTPAVAGGSLYGNEAISVGPTGNLSLILSGGARAVLGPNSGARLTSDGGVVTLELTAGRAAFSAAANLPFAVRVGDARLRPASQTQAVAVVTFTAPGRASIYVDKGEWTVVSDSGRSTTLRAGEKLDGALVQSDDQNNKNRRRAAFLWLGTGIAGTATAVGMAFGMTEDGISKQTRSNAVSPTDP